MNIVKYTPEYENLKENFTCGNVVIDNFLRNGNALDENQGITYVLLSDKIGCCLEYSNAKSYAILFVCSGLIFQPSMYLIGKFYHDIMSVYSQNISS